jgi:DNA-directed RNA polymerase subunit RPC12/RpoP
MSLAAHRVRPEAARLPTDRRTVGHRVRRVGLWLFFTSIAVNAALGIYAVLTPDFGETQGKILATSLCVTGAVLVALACEPAWERRLLGPVPLAGAILGAAGFALVIAGIWSEPESATLGRLTGSTLTLAVACAIASLLALARLAPRHEWVFTVTLGLLALGAGLLAVLPWLGDDPNEVYVRGMGVVLIALAAFAVTVPVLHWIDRGALAVAASPDAVRFCPHCGKELTGELGVGVECPRCGRRFTVAVSEPDLT